MVEPDSAEPIWEPALWAAYPASTRAVVLNGADRGGESIEDVSTNAKLT